MRVALYTLHYGREYLAHSIRSVQDAVDQILIHYAPTPSFGHTQGLPCPDTEEALYAAAHRFATKPIVWRRGTWGNEWQHRDAAYADAQLAGATHAVVVDADEVWDPHALATAFTAIEQAPVRHGRWMATFANFWRSFHWMVHDHFTPIRFIDFAKGLHDQPVLLPAEAQPAPVYHFGYAQRVELMRYKWTCHGHQLELRPGWFDRFLRWQPEDTDLHPVVNHLWDRAHRTPDIVETALARILPDHPYAGLAIIE